MRQLALCIVCGFLCTGLLEAQMSHSVQPMPGIDRFVNVPFLYEHPERGRFALQYELGRKFDSTKPTVFVIADGQQFYVQKGLVRPLQDELFGQDFNVVGIFGRGTNDSVRKRIRQGDAVNWESAYDTLKSNEWVEDIESVRRAVLGPRGKVLLYGRSGGGLLVHQYLAKHPDHVRAVFTQAAVNRFLDAEFGLSSDTFWDEIGAYDKKLQPLLLEVLQRHAGDRNRIMLLLQRQNFFVPADRIDAERSRLIHLLDDWNEQEIARLSKDYQVDAILSTLGKEDPAGNVRLFEMFAPVLRGATGSAAQRVDPDIEVGAMFAAPLMRLMNEGRIAMPSMDLRALHRVQADVYMLAGRYDHTANYRSQIALASHYPNHRLLLLADGHDFLELGKTGLYPQLVQTALSSGIHGPERAGLEQKLASLVYHER